MIATGGHYSISNLREQPAFADVVSDRIWNAWWRDEGHPLSFISELVEISLASAGIPAAFVAHEGARFLGTSSLIESDMEDRPQYSPWVAAVWVDEDQRQRGIGAALVRAAADAAFAQCIGRVYLCASMKNAPFYEKLGWSVIERDIDGYNVLALDAEGSGL